MHKLRQEHCGTVLRYIKSTPSWGFLLRGYSNLQLQACYDSYWVCHPITRHSLPVTLFHYGILWCRENQRNNLLSLDLSLKLNTNLRLSPFVNGNSWDISSLIFESLTSIPCHYFVILKLLFTFLQILTLFVTRPSILRSTVISPAINFMHISPA